MQATIYSAVDSAVNWQDNRLPMTDSIPNELDPEQLRHRALSRWDNEGGAPLDDHQEGVIPGEVQSEVPPLTNADLTQLRVRVIALENLVISLLSQSTDRQLDLVREMATYISLRSGFTAHHLTIRAAAEMIHLIARAGHFRDIHGAMSVLKESSVVAMPHGSPKEGPR